MIRRIVNGPEEGWLSLGLILLMCVVMAWAIDDVAPVMGIGEYTDFLTWAAVGGVFFGFIGPQVGWGRWRTYLVGSIFAALLLPIVVGGNLDHAPGLAGQFVATATAAVNAYFDLVYYQHAFTQEYGHHLLVIGLVIWATSMFAAYAAFGHRRPINAVVMVGVVLVINMSLTPSNQLGYMVVYSLASLVLLIRFHALDEQSEWLRRRIGDPTAISSIYLRGGSAFIALAVVGSMVLTLSATSAPLAGAWDGVSSNVIDMTRSFAKFLPGGPNNRSFDADFGEDTLIRGYWISSGGVAATIAMPPGAPKGLYWKAVTFDRFDLSSWQSTRPADVPRAAGDTLLDGTLDEIPPGLATTSLTFTVTPESYTGKYILSPLIPDKIDQDTTVKAIGPGGFTEGIVRDSSSQTYQVTAAIPVTDGSNPGGIDQAKLIEAGTDYPPEVTDLYLPKTEYQMGTEATKLLAQMLEVAGGQDKSPFEIAESFQSQFQDPANFTYQADVSQLNCARDHLSTVDCFATYKRGYCQYYATTMAVFLRELGIPSRLVEGYLPGSRDSRTGIETLLEKDRHEWVEVYFPGYGWQMFDPTGGKLADQLVPLAPGQASASHTPKPSGSRGPASSAGATKDPFGERPDGAGSVGSSGKGPGAGLLGAIAVLLLIVMGSVAFIVWRRGPRGGTSPDRAYGTVTRIASRLGFGPRPNQTVYEYAGALADVLPDARPALETVARAKVESTYGRTDIAGDRLQALREAERRLRVSLLRLVFRRGKRPV